MATPSETLAWYLSSRTPGRPTTRAGLFLSLFQDYTKVYCCNLYCLLLQLYERLPLQPCNHTNVYCCNPATIRMFTVATPFSQPYCIPLLQNSRPCQDASGPLPQPLSASRPLPPHALLLPPPSFGLRFYLRIRKYTSWYTTLGSILVGI